MSFDEALKSFGSAGKDSRIAAWSNSEQSCLPPVGFPPGGILFRGEVRGLSQLPLQARQVALADLAFALLHA